MVATLIKNHLLKTNEPNVAVDQTTQDRTVEMDNNNVIITLPSQTQPTPQQPTGTTKDHLTEPTSTQMRQTGMTVIAAAPGEAGDQTPINMTKEPDQDPP